MCIRTAKPFLPLRQMRIAMMKKEEVAELATYSEENEITVINNG